MSSIIIPCGFVLILLLLLCESNDAKLLGYFATARDRFNNARINVLRYQAQYKEEDATSVKIFLDEYKSNLEEALDCSSSSQCVRNAEIENNIKNARFCLKIDCFRIN